MRSDQLALDFGGELAPATEAPRKVSAKPRFRSGAAIAQPAPAPVAPTGPFHYTNAMWEVVRDMVGTLEELRYIDLDRVLLSIAQARQASKHGVYASCVPLRFEAGASETQVGKRRFRMPAVVH